MPIITRNIQWYGLVRFPDTADIDRIHWWRLSATMVRRPISEYRNDGVWQPPRGFWGNVVARKAQRRLDNWQLEFTQQLVAERTYSEAFLLQATNCQLDAVLQSFVNQNTGLGLVTISVNNPTRDWVAYRYIPDEFSIKMQGEDAIGQFDLEWEELPSCEVYGTSPPPPPLPPPIPPPNYPVPPGEPSPIPISPAYDGNNDDGQTYNPQPEPPGGYPQGEFCQQYRVTITYDDGGTTITDFINVWGTIEDIFYRPPVPPSIQGSIIILCRGIPLFPCNESGFEEVGFVLNGADALISVDEILPL